MQYTYDSLSRVLTEVQGSNPLGSTGKTVTYTYDDDGNRTRIDYPSGFDANETRDALGRLTEVKDASNVSIAAFDLYGAGLRRKKTSFGNGNTSELVYDGFRRPVEINHKLSGGSEFAGQDYAWDKNDNPLMEKRSHESGKGDVYTYDKANRLTKVLTDVVDPAAELATPGSQNYQDKLEYDMDDVFNLTAYKVTPQGGSLSTTSYTTNAMNEYTAVGGTTHLYTDNGALKDDGTNTYKYDGHDRLIEVTWKSDSVVIGTYAYDAVGLGRRTKKTVPVSGGSKTTRYVYAGLQSIEELDGSTGNLDRLFVFGGQIDQILAMESPDHADVDGDSNTSEVLRFSYHVQLIGSVTHVTAPSGSVVESYRYDPYGKPTIKDAGGNTVTSSAIKNPYLFTARQFDEETGLYYYRARMYSASLRRFIQRYPLEYVDGPNAAGYVRGAPIGRLDSTGTQETSEPGRNSDVDYERKSSTWRDEATMSETKSSRARARAELLLTDGDERTMVEASFWEEIKKNITVSVVAREDEAQYHFYGDRDGSCAIGRTFKHRSRAEATIHWPQKPRVTARRVLFDRSSQGAATAEFPHLGVRVSTSEWSDDEHERRHSKHWGEAYKSVVKKAGNDEVIDGGWSKWWETQAEADKEASALALAAAIKRVKETEVEVNRRFRELTDGGSPDWPYNSDVLLSGFHSVVAKHQ